MKLASTIPPTNKRFKIPGTLVSRVVGGRISEVRVCFDIMRLMGQLGLGP
ncbi:ester cyclase [Candidatus Bathyarchaeota archaeon]|nr:MAG: ester cyclase [Candidatus Bathyarchaeota archaeon]